MTDGRGAGVRGGQCRAQRAQGLPRLPQARWSSGGHGDGYGLPLTVDTADLIYGQRNVLGTRASTLQDVVEVARLVEHAQLKPVVSQRLPLEQANEAMAVLREDSPLGRIVLQ